MDFTSQREIYNPEKQRSNVIVLGAGSTGSFVALTLAKMGINNLKVIDFDVVEGKNIPNQFYRVDDINKDKVDALKEIVKLFTGTDISVEKVKIDESYNFDFSLNTIIINCVDNMETRKLVYDKIKEFPITLIDTRFGSEGFSIHNIKLENENERKLYEDSLNLEILETLCGQKGVIYSILNLSSEVCNIVKKIDQNEKSPIVLKREMKTHRFLTKEREA